MNGDFLSDLRAFDLSSPEFLLLAAMAVFFGWLAVQLVLGKGAAPRSRKGSRKRYSRSYGRTWQGQGYQKPMPDVAIPKPDAEDLSNPQTQLEAISQVNFERRRLLNKTEYNVLRVLEKIVAESGDRHRIMAQTSLGELIQPKSSSASAAQRKRAHASINSKRLDFAIVDRFGLLAVAIEVQGSGHYHQKTFLRDAVKREALRRAGIELVEIQTSWQDEDIENHVRRFLRARVPEASA